MQQAQDQLEFQIETPSDEEIAKRFAKNQEQRSGLYSQKPQVKHKKRVKKNDKKLARANKQFKKRKAVVA